MAKYFLVEDGTDKILKSAESDREFRNGTPPILSGKPFRWLEVVIIHPEEGANQVTEGPTVNITATQYTKTWTVRDKTEQELDADKDGRATIKIAEWKALMTALNDGSFVPGQDLTEEEMKAVIKEHL